MNPLTVLELASTFNCPKLTIVSTMGELVYFGSRNGFLFSDPEMFCIKDIYNIPVENFKIKEYMSGELELLIYVSEEDVEKLEGGKENDGC